LTLWDSSELEVWSTVSQEHMLIIHGRFVRTNEEFHLFNVYAPCDLREKQLLWTSLTARLRMLRGLKVCVCGDFNAVINVEERKSVRGTGGALDSLYLIILLKKMC